MASTEQADTAGSPAVILFFTAVQTTMMTFRQFLEVSMIPSNYQSPINLAASSDQFSEGYCSRQKKWNNQRG